MDWYVAVLKKYAAFSGRARRSEFWYFTLFNVLITIVLAIVDFETTRIGALTALYGLAVLIPGLAVEVRRLHDTNRSGWWLFIAFVPLVGAILLLVFFVQDSQTGENRYGPNPKAEAPTLGSAGVAS